jgi:hypothetical protein
MLINPRLILLLLLLLTTDHHRTGERKAITEMIFARGNV